MAATQFPHLVGANESTVKRFMEFYRHFSSEQMHCLGDVYTQDIEFIDPVHRISGLLGLKKYLKGMAVNLGSYSIVYSDSVILENTAYITWDMECSHPRLNSGRTITVRGMTHLKYTDKVYYHEDCYDLGALVYENLPLLGLATRSIRKKMAKG